MAIQNTACPTRQNVALFLMVAMLVSFFGLFALVPGQAWSDTRDEVAQARQTVAARSEEYAQAMAATEQAQAQVADCQSRIAALEAQVPAARENAAVAMRTQYKYSQNAAGLLELILSADGFESFISMVSYLNAVQGDTEYQLEQLLELEGQLAQENATLEELLSQCRQYEAQAQEALEEALAAQSRAEARLAAEEEAARQAAAAAAAAAAQQQSSIVTVVDEQTGENVYYEQAPDGSLEEVDEEHAQDVIDQEQQQQQPGNDGGGASVGSDVDMWAARIDAYLAGSPLAGYGRDFAAAALTYGVDPRWSPAISMIESTQGRYCFRPYNAWGWMGHSFSSWSEAIWEHVSYLGWMYGGQLTWEAANIYCDPGDEWYYAVKGQMECI